MAIRNDMLAEVASRLIGEFQKRILQYRPTENIDTHGCKITPWMFRFLLKFRDSVIIICNNDSETACLLKRNRHCRDRHIRMVLFMEIQHHLIVHLINVVTG